MSKMVSFYHGALGDPYEDQARAQGFTLGNKAEFVQKVGFGLIAAHIHGVVTDKEYDKILQRFQKKMITKNLKPLEGGEHEEAVTDSTDPDAVF